MQFSLYEQLWYKVHYCHKMKFVGKSSKRHQQCTAKNGDADEKVVDAIRNILPRMAMRMKKQ